MVTVTYEEISSAFEFVGSGAPMEHWAYISVDTGHIYCTSEVVGLDEEIPDDLDATGRYLLVPHKTELGLGRDLALHFAAEQLPDAFERVARIFRSKGAYARFKELLADKGLLEDWYKFEAEACDRALREWCAANDIQLVESSAPSAA